MCQQLNIPFIDNRHIDLTFMAEAMPGPQSLVRRRTSSLWRLGLAAAAGFAAALLLVGPTSMSPVTVSSSDSLLRARGSNGAERVAGLNRTSQGAPQYEVHAVRSGG
jgi:hypothetical protein